MSQETLLYFAYGSNMNSKRLTSPKRVPSAVKLETGYVKKHKLTFDKISTDGSAKCDCEFTGNDDDRVHGVIFRIKKSQKPNLDRAEGLGHGYDESIVEVLTASGEFQAVTYIATKKNQTLKPYHWYKRHVTFGATEHGLPNDYIAKILAVDSIPDLDAARVSNEMQYLPQDVSEF